MKLRLFLGLTTIYFNTSLVTFTSGGRVSDTSTIFTISNCHKWGMEGGSASKFGQCHQMFRFFFLKASLRSIIYLSAIFCSLNYLHLQFKYMHVLRKTKNQFLSACDGRQCIYIIGLHLFKLDCI